MKTTLNRKQQRFALEYIKDFNATRAAKAAGYAENTAEKQSHRLLKHVGISRFIDEVLARAKDQISEEWVIFELLDNYKKAKLEGNHQITTKYQELLMKYKQLLTDKQVIETADVADFLKNEISKAANKDTDSTQHSDNMADNKEEIKESAKTS